MSWTNLPSVGESLHGFELIRELGRGSFARVFLARQTTLDRLVALKVSPNMGQEARTLAGLEHDHIVRVFSEETDLNRDLCLICMQYVPGTTLSKVIADTVLVERAAMTVLASSSLPRQAVPTSFPGSAPGIPEAIRAKQTIPAGQAILELVDSQNADDVLLDLAALRDRDRLQSLDLLETVCWMGARLAEALAYAHARGVLHRDVKPANILINRYGRPLLLDFNVSASAAPLGSSFGKGTVGGTLAYMAPEHIDAFNPDNFTPAEAVDARSDIYSLGVVLYELLTGRLPFPALPAGPLGQILQVMADARRNGPPPIDPTLEAPPMFDRILARCLAGNPSARYSNAGDLASDLRNCLRMQRVQRDLPKGFFVTPFAVRYPFLVGLLLVLLPHLLATVVNIAYNDSRIVKHLSDEQQALFPVVTVLYNLVMYPFTLVMYLRQVVPVFRVWRKLASTEPIASLLVDAARRRALGVPRWGICLSANAWFLGGIVFPVALRFCAPGTLKLDDTLHFAISFTLSGLIAMTYSVIAMEFIVLRVLYPGLWLDARNMRAVAQEELRPAGRRLVLWQFLAVIIPLIGAILMIQGSPDTVDPGYYRTFRLLVTGLLSLGMVGLGLTLLAAGILRDTIAVLISGTPTHSSRRPAPDTTIQTRKTI